MTTLTLVLPNNGFIKAVHINAYRFADTLLNIPLELFNAINHYIPTHEKIISYIHSCYDSHSDNNLNIESICHVCNLEVATICHDETWQDGHDLCLSCYMNKKYCKECAHLDWYNYDNLVKKMYCGNIFNGFQIHAKINSICGASNFCNMCRWPETVNCLSCGQNTNLIEFYHPSLLEGFKKVYFCRNTSCNLDHYRKMINKDLLRTANEEDFNLLIQRIKY